MKIVLNVNDKVEVTLTGLGFKVYKDNIEKWSLNSSSANIRIGNKKAGDKFIFQIHELMNIFGSESYIGNNNLFDNNEITLLE